MPQFEQATDQDLDGKDTLGEGRDKYSWGPTHRKHWHCSGMRIPHVLRP